MSFTVRRFNDKWDTSGGKDGTITIWDSENNNEDGIARSRSGGRDIFRIVEPKNVLYSYFSIPSSPL